MMRRQPPAVQPLAYLLHALPAPAVVMTREQPMKAPMLNLPEGTLMICLAQLHNRQLPQLMLRVLPLHMMKQLLSTWAEQLGLQNRRISTASIVASVTQTVSSLSLCRLILCVSGTYTLHCVLLDVQLTDNHPQSAGVQPTVKHAEACCTFVSLAVLVLMLPA